MCVCVFQAIMPYTLNLHCAAKFNYILIKLGQKSCLIMGEKWNLVKTELQSCVRGPMVKGSETQDLAQKADAAISENGHVQGELK